MKEASCEVFKAAAELSELSTTGRLVHPRCLQRVESLLELLEDISAGSAGPDHLSLLRSTAERLAEEGPDTVCRNAGRRLIDALDTHGEVFRSHIETGNCPTGDCRILTPAPCQMACPAGIDVPGYVTLVAMGREDEAVELIRKDNPFPWVCGLVCTHPCEFMCVRGRIDTPVAIKEIKAFAAERAISEGRYRNPEKAPDTGKRVCVVGAGPAGLTAAYYLALKGHRVAVLEALPHAGGMLMVGIPRYRLPREVIDREVAAIEELGVTFRFNTRLGRDVSLDDLQDEGFDAYFLAVGAHSAYAMRIPGEDRAPQVLEAVGLLRRTALGDRRRPGRRVAVIGGGNVAIDAARTSLRLGAEEVTLIYRRTRSEMPASEEEILQAEEEGVRFCFLTVPTEVACTDDCVSGLSCIRTELGPPDESGRRRPAAVEGSDHLMDLDAVITAIGQEVDPAGIDGWKGLRWTHRRTISARTASMETSVPGVFAGGDAVLGPATVVEAIGAGKRASLAMDRYLQGLPQPNLPPVPVRRQRLPFLEASASFKMSLRRPEMAMLNRERRRITFQQVELGLTEDQARNEGLRCLRCDVCIRCGRCVEICRDRMGIDALQLGHFDFDHPVATDLRTTAERCILCGACAENCPTGAMRIEERGEERILSLCGTVLNRLKIERCSRCGASLGPARYHDYIRDRVKGLAVHGSQGRLCTDCGRKALGRSHADIAAPGLRERGQGGEGA